MEHSKQFEDVVALGKKLVSQLGLEHSTDTLGHWMAHHISELIIEVEQGEGAAKSAIEERCRNAILDLWKHVEVFPRGARPLENLEPIIATIRALDPNDRAFFYQKQAQEAAEKSNLPEGAKEWLTLSRGLDYSARLLIKMCLEYAANNVSSENQEWFEHSENAFDTELPIINIVRMISDDEVDEAECENEEIKERIKLLQDREDRLRGMVEMAELLASAIKKEIIELES